MTAAHLLGRITYTSIYVFLCFVLTLLLLIVPADIVRQVLRHTFQQANVLILAIVYVFTLIVVTFVYVLRLYTTRAVLASISVPRPRIPVFEKGDGVKVNADVRAVIRAGLSGSAAIAWAARPKVIPREEAGARPSETVVENDDSAGETGTDDPRYRDGADDPDDNRKPSCLRLFDCFGSNKKKKQGKKTTTAEDQMGIALPPMRPVWGHIEHDGWESPDSPDLPNLQYSTVLAELPNLIEAKAVSLAPPLDPESAPAPNNTPQTQTLDPEAVMLLQRALNMSMRDYVGHLTGLGVLPSGDDDNPEQQQAVSEFLDVYERARFSTRPMSRAHFRNLMHLFAEVLRVMRPAHPSALYGHGFEDEADDDAAGRSYYNDYDRASTNSVSLSLSQSESDGQHIDDDAPRDGTPTTPAHSIATGSLIRLDSRSSSNSVRSSNASAHSQRRRRPPPRPHSLQPPHNSHRGSIYSYSYRDRNSSANTGHRYRTAPTTPMSRRQFSVGGGGRTSEESSESPDAFARRAGPPYYAAGSPSSSSASLRSRRPSGASGASAGSQSQGSVVIRLTRPEDRDARGLPYVLRVGDEL
ncbi:hypothetical protein DL771_006102 [Monosporascus sp. 5C6A]|nr:hypothetical protein DL771_006102 [Monosporascus sp. 5C6A]